MSDMTAGVGRDVAPGAGDLELAFHVTGLDCPDCAKTVVKSVRALAGVVSAELNFASGTLVLVREPGADVAAEVARAIERSGHGAIPLRGVAEVGAEATPPTWWRRHRTESAVVGSGLFGLAAWAAGLAGAGEPTVRVLFALAIAAGWTLLLPRALNSLRIRSVDMNVLMLVAVTGAALAGDLGEAATVVFLFALGGMLESRALARTRTSIRSLMELAPRTVRVRRGGVLAELALDDVLIGEVFVVRPGERVALDGVIRTGMAHVDEAPVTGEPVPVAKQPGDAVYAGSLATDGLLDIEATALATDSTVARIVHLVEEAQSARAPMQQIVDRFSAVYTPVVVSLAVALAVLPPLAGVLLNAPWASPHEWFMRALVLLVVSCPCALVISTPVTIVSAIGRAGRDGVLVKGGAVLELAARVRAVAFDKTGTLTQGRPRLDAVLCAHGLAPDDVLALAASLAAHSTHPLSRAVHDAALERSLALTAAADVAELPGRGVSARLEGAESLLVSPAFAEEIARIPVDLAAAVASAEDAGSTVLVLVRDGAALGALALSDTPRAGLPALTRRLAAGGIEHLVMLTGDNERTAAAIAAHAGLTAHMARLLPAEKVDAVARLKERYGTVAMVGDGINDAPALATADVGIAIGAAASDVALETADVALLGDDLRALPGFFELARSAVSTIRANIVFSLAVKLGVLVLAFLGIATLWMAVFADTGVALLVIANGMRLLRAPVRARAAA